MGEEEKKGKQGKWENLAVFDPEKLPYQVQHLCKYWRELKEAAEKEEAEKGKPE